VDNGWDGTGNARGTSAGAIVCRGRHGARLSVARSSIGDRIVVAEIGLDLVYTVSNLPRFRRSRTTLAGCPGSSVCLSGSRARAQSRFDAKYAPGVSFILRKLLAILRVRRERRNRSRGR
jgi:hypothetical protein